MLNLFAILISLRVTFTYKFVKILAVLLYLYFRNIMSNVHMFRAIHLISVTAVINSIHKFLFVAKQCVIGFHGIHRFLLNTELKSFSKHIYILPEGAFCLYHFMTLVSATIHSDLFVFKIDE